MDTQGNEPLRPAPPALLARARRLRRSRFAPLLELLLTLALALGLAESVQAAVLKPFVIPSKSMEPTLTVGQRVLVNRLIYDFRAPARGDIIVFHPPSSLQCATSTTPQEPCPRGYATPARQYFVKRIVGLPGERIAIRDGHPVINGKLLRDEPYIAACGGAIGCDMPQAITIPRGEYFVMGDNRGDSDDSRFWGPVPARWVVGEVFATYWPLDRVGIF